MSSNLVIQDISVSDTPVTLTTELDVFDLYDCEIAAKADNANVITLTINGTTVELQAGEWYGPFARACLSGITAQCASGLTAVLTISGRKC